MKLKSIRIQKQIEELEELLQKNEKGILENSEEALNKNGVANNAALYISLMEARNLKSEKLLDESVPYVTLCLDNETYQSKSVNEGIYPVWNEDFILY